MRRILPSIILLILLLGSVYIAQKHFNKPEIPELFTIPAFEFPSHHDMTFSNNNFADKISVVNFIFTNCPGICPVMTRKMSVIYEENADEGSVQFVSFSVDPARDSLLALKAYAEKWHVTDQRWHFLRTEKEKIQNLYEQGFKLGGDLPYGHSGAFVLVDQKGMIRGYYSYEDEEELQLLRNDLSILIDEI